MSRLHNGQPFPSLEVPAVGGGTIALPDDLAGSYGVVLIYRGSWCPYCNAQLAGFSRGFDALAELGVKVVALSVDDEETSAALVAKHKLRFPVGHSADAGKVAAATGADVNDDPRYLQSTGFVLAPDGTVQVAVYSSDAIGRLVADDVAGYVSYLTQYAA
jgi:peroxiredoxin